MNILSLHHILFSHFLQVSIEYPIIVPYDVQIAALAMTRNISVVTINYDEFGRITWIKVEDLTKE